MVYYSSMVWIDLSDDNPLPGRLVSQDGGWPRYRFQRQNTTRDVVVWVQDEEGGEWSFETLYNVPNDVLAYVIWGQQPKTGKLRVNSVFGESTVACPVKLSPLERVVQAAMHNGAAFGDYVAAGVIYNTSVAGWDPEIYFANDLQELSEQEKTFRECWGENYTQEEITQAIIHVASIRRGPR
jgi:hypothetical protein